MFTQEDFSVALKCSAQAVTTCLLSPAENKKSHVLHFNNHNSGSKHSFGAIALSYPPPPPLLRLRLGLGLSYVSS